MRTVVEFNGPGNNGSEVRDGIAYEIKGGDIVVIPAGTGHWFTRIEDHIDYIMVRIDPDKVTPLKRRGAIAGVLVQAGKAAENETLVRGGLPRGNAVFQRLGQLLVNELEREAFFEVSHHPGLDFA